MRKRRTQVIWSSLCLIGLLVCSVLAVPHSYSAIRGDKFSILHSHFSTDAVDQDPKKVRIDLLYADEAVADQNKRPDVQVLRGSVKLKHDSMYMYCDSALIFEKINSVEAFGNVRMEQGDTLFIFGDYMYYDGIAQLAKLRENVKLINRETQLETDSLDYDRVQDLGYYFDGGTLRDTVNVLTSVLGEYSPATKQAVFEYNVELVNPQFTLTSEDLTYNTVTKIATINSDAEIVNEQSHIYTSSGIYNTVTEQGELFNRSVVVNEGRLLTGDTLLYDRQQGFGEAFGNVALNDTVNKNMLTGDYCYYDELKENAYATKRAVAVDYSQGDSLFMHGDTLRLVTFYPKTDSAYREMRAYYKVRAYRSDIQSVCDSLVLNSKDSCMTMYRDPVLWHGEEQLLGELVKVFSNDSTIERAHIINQALAIERYDSVHYNQITGKEMIAHFEAGEIKETEVNGNVLTIYYPIDEKDSTIIVMVYAEGSYLKMFMKDRKMDKGMFIGKTTGTAYPLDQVPKGKDRLSAFVWFDYMRPKDKNDIFDWRGKPADQVLKKVERESTGSPRDVKVRHGRR